MEIKSEARVNAFITNRGLPFVQYSLAYLRGRAELRGPNWRGSDVS